MELPGGNRMNRTADPIVLFGTTSLPGYHLATAYSGWLIPYCTSRTKKRLPEDWRRLDLVNSDEIARTFQGSNAGTLIYTDAVCDVEKCEGFRDWATSINVDHLRRTVDSMPSTWRMVYLSSDHVFGGDGSYDEASEVCPISHYGRTRAAAETVLADRPNTLIIRAGLGVGSSFDGRTGHLDWLRYRMVSGLPVTIIRDEARSVVSIRCMTDRIWALATSEITGLRHLAAPATTRSNLARQLINHLDLPGEVAIVSRHQRPYPHLGYVELRTQYEDSLATPLAPFTPSHGELTV